MIEVYFYNIFSKGLLFVKNDKFQWSDHVASGYKEWRLISDHNKVPDCMKIKLFEIIE